MAEMINRGKELIRINPAKRNRLEYSTSSGRGWNSRYSGSVCGDFIDLTDNGKELLATTGKGLYFYYPLIWEKRGKPPFGKCMRWAKLLECQGLSSLFSLGRKALRPYTQRPGRF